MSPVAECREMIGKVFACPAEVADDILSRGQMRAFPGQAILVRQGDPAVFTWLLIVGRAQAILYSIEGQLILLQEFGPGDLFGALGEIDPVPLDADVVAIEDIEAFLLRGAELVMLAERHGTIGLALARLLLRRLRRTTTRIYERSALSAVGRIHAELLRRARAAPDLTIRPGPILAELAVAVATTRETVSRAVNALERRGIIRRDADSLTVVAPRTLEELVL